MNSTKKNFEKSGAALLVVGISRAISYVLCELGLPEDSEPYITTAISGLIFGLVNRIKHSKKK